MEHEKQEMESLYIKRIDLYRDLLSCIKRERDNLINQDIDGIWNSLKEKNEILHSIKDVNGCVDRIRKESSKEDILTVEEKQTFINLSKTLTALKEEIRARLKENILFIRDTLGFINDIFSAFANNPHRERPYGRSRHRQNGSGNLLYHNEA